MKVRLKFSSNKTLTSWLVRVFTASEYSHVDYVFDDYRCYSSLPRKGVDFTTDMRFDRSCFCEIEVPSKVRIEQFLIAQRGKKYDWKSIIAFPFRAPWNKKKRWFCSELISAALEEEINMFEMKHNRITPADLYNHPLIKSIT